jgi:bifunctional DNA-binding transcriptional regulator/antitoxin component of YhaV-PrlF toxin-antitoxin module
MSELGTVTGGILTMTVTLKNKKPLVVPDAVRRKAGLRSGDRIEFQVSGRVINIVPKLPAAVEDECTPKVVTQIIEESKKHPMRRAELRAENARLMAYGARQAKKAGIKERDIPRLIHEFRSRRRTS